MRTIAKLSLLTSTVAFLVSSAAFADNQQQQQLLAMQRDQTARENPATTVAVSANGHGVGRGAAKAARSESRFELRYNAHGQVYGAHVPAK